LAKETKGNLQPIATMSPIPFFYRVMFNYLEPTMATLGALQAIFAPGDLLRYTVPTLQVTPAMSPLFTHMAGSWLMFSFHDVVTLRVYQDVRVWKYILGAAILSDVGYIVGVAQGMGLEWFSDPLQWEAGNTFAIVATMIPLLAKIAFVLGVGLSAKTERMRATKKEP
jgi:hypothetical protein